MSSIRIQSPTQTWEADQARVFKVGRDPAADIVADDPTVSRAHAEIRALGDGWEVVDLGSSVGTWVNGQRIQRADLVGTMAIGFGAPGSGLIVTVTVVGAQPPPPTPAPPPPPAPPTDRPVDLAATGMAPPPPPLAQTMVTFGGAPGVPGMGPGLLIRPRIGADLRFGPGAPVRIGREPGLEVVTDDPAVSRHHAVVEPRPDGWWWVDSSTSGTYQEGERVSSFRIEEPVELVLGHPTAGFELEVIPVVAAGEAAAGIVRKKRRRTLALVGGAAALLLVVGGITAVSLLAGDDGNGPASATDTGQLSQADLDRAKAAAVFLTAIDDTGTPIYTGSGSIISDEGLILTNAHVGKPTAPGQGASEGGDPAYLLVSLTSGADDKPATPTFRAEPIVADGYLDLAVLQIVSDADGNDVAVGDMNLPEPLPIGNSADLHTGDEITALGYPAIGNVSEQLSKPLTVTRGVVSTFQADEVIGTERGFIDSDVRLGSGNSGGPSINDDGEIIGINTAVITANSEDAGFITSGSALIRPVDLAEEVLRIAEDGGDPEYVSPYVEDMPTPPSDVPTDASYTSAGWVKEGDQGSCENTSTVDSPQILSVTAGETLYAEYVIAGLPDGTPIGVTLYSLDGETQLGSLQDTWTFGTDSVCIYVPFEAPEGVPGINGVFVVGEEGSPVVDNPLAYQ